MIFGAYTHKGKVREHNEDSYKIVFEHCDNVPVFIVADGMGGHSHGEIASNLAVSKVAEIMSEGDICSQEAKDLINKVFKSANHAICQKANENENMYGMGTTMIMGIVKNEVLHLGHVGDSRAYVYSNGILKRLTEDHSFVQELIKSGTITPEEAKVHPQKHVITRALGGKHSVEVDYSEYIINSGDVFLFCTDGLTNMVGENVISQEISKNFEPQRLCEELVRIANENGGEDNITVLIFKEN